MKNYVATLEGLLPEPHKVRGLTPKKTRIMINICWTPEGLSVYGWNKIQKGGVFKLTALGNLSFTEEEVAPSDEPCGECELCKFAKYDSDDPKTHCINCDCIMCIPGG